MRRSFSFAAPLLVLAFVISGCASAETDAVGSDGAALALGEVLFYPAGKPVDADELTDLGPPESIGGTVIEGDPHLSARIDFSDGSRLAGVFQATHGELLLHFPFTEHATVSHGQVAITDETGRRHVFHAGDSYLIQQGTSVVWDVPCGRVQTSFLRRVEPASTPGPMIVYSKGSVVRAADLVDLGPPEGLGGTVIDGDPHIAARIDDAGDGALAGVFQATHGTVLVDYPFTEHATITRWNVDLVDESGREIHMTPGDAYLILQGSHILWDVHAPRVQKSFFNFQTP